MATRGVKFQRVLKHPTDAPDSALSGKDPDLAVAEMVGRLMHFWGFKRPMGRVWAVLYLSAPPLPASTLGETLKMSSGAVSMALAELEKWGAVSRTWIPGDRRDFFTAEDDIWKLVRRVIKERELTLVREFGRSLNEAKTALNEKEKVAAASEVHALNYKRTRLERLSFLSSAGETLLAALVEGAVVNPGPLLSPDERTELS